ncbi:DUF4240 domain-containing protein [Solimonas sp. K1W22B-7]|uniref:DUF4240 domain-containing protein n=1 Tax=Solimonas sp. K1W22B-7 TaxID=2303331 RepID=UPI000E333953|nr:DUF4240 domain-containing protein [Solimonas sp. K1W22B-7]AXQ30418.1 DUF4240 domain-containing protein [Solimonas sp. K1W22B-7]
MDKAAFWKIIDASRRDAEDDPEEQLETLRERLSSLEPAEIVSFDRILSEYHGRADTWDLWGAAYIIGGGCSDDGFMDFRGWLISRGEKAYEAALADPESLVKVVKEHDGECQIEGYQYVASEVWEEKTGKTSDDFPSHDLPMRTGTSGTPWEESDLDERFPKLSKKFS